MASGPLPVAAEVRTCTGCRVTKPRTEFPLRSGRSIPPGTRIARCRECYRAAKRAEYHDPRYHEKLKARMQHTVRRIRYGIEPHEYEAMIAAQRGLCAICGQPETRSGGRGRTPLTLSVDHDHATGKIRALLCAQCNAGLGSFRDNPALMLAAIEYLRRHRG